MLHFAWPLIAAITVLSLLVWPWSNDQVQQLRTQFEQRSDIDRIAPGEFQESSDGSRVIFIDKDSVSETSASNIFLVETRQGKELITSAKSASVETTSQARTAILTQGQRIENNEATQDLKVTHFAEYRLRLEESASGKAEMTTKSTSTPDLLSSPTPMNLGELGWRISQPLVALNLVLLALGITSVNPRAGNSTSLAIALLTFVIYYNLMNVGQSWVAAQRISLTAYLLGLHGGVLAIAVAALTMRHHRWSVRDLWQRRGGHTA